MPGLGSYLLEKLGDIIQVKDVRPNLAIEGKYWDIGIKLRDYQEEAVLSGLKRQRGVIIVPTGGGKTYIASAILKGFLSHSCVYLVHRLVLLNQVRLVLKESLKEKVGCISGKEIDIDGRRVVVAMVQSLSVKGRYEGHIKQWMKTVKVSIIDECHHSASKIFSSVLRMFENMVVKIGLTGTLPEDEITSLKIRGLLGDVLYKVPVNELVDRKYIVVPKVQMIEGDWSVGLRSLFDNIKWTGFGVERKIWDKIRTVGIIQNQVRNDKIIQIVNEYRDKRVSGILIIVDMIEHGQILSDRLNVPFVWSGSEEKVELFDQFKNGKISTLVCSPVLEEGIDVRGIKVIVICGGGKSKIKLLQRIGRGMRKQVGKFDVEIIDFFDSEIPLLERHSKSRLKIYKDEGYQVERISDFDR